MAAHKSTQNRPVVQSTPPIPCTVALRRLEIAYTKKCEELERAQKRIEILEHKLDDARKNK